MVCNCIKTKYTELIIEYYLYYGLEKRLEGRDTFQVFFIS